MFPKFLKVEFNWPTEAAKDFSISAVLAKMFA